MVSIILGSVDTIEGYLNDESKPWKVWLDRAERKLNMKKLHIFGIAVVMLALYLVFGYGAQLLCNTIGFGYPAYASIKAIESPQKGDDTKWLTYWTVFAAFSLLEFFSNIIVGWIPIYWLVKCVFFIWCFAPVEGNGSAVLYQRLLRPHFLKYQDRVDSALKDATDKVAKAVTSKLLEGEKTE